MPSSTTNLMPAAGTATARAAGPAAAVAAPDYGAIKTRQQATWSAVDFGRIGVRLQIVGESLCEAVDLRAGERVIDVAAGNGNASLAAARRFADVTSTDYVAELLDQGLRRADADGLSMVARLADAEDLPFEDGTFDVALSTFGVMFAPNPPRAAGEMLRVVKPGGRIGLSSWTPDGFVGQLLRVVGRFVPPPAGVTPPTAWGTETRIVPSSSVTSTRSLTSAHAAQALRLPFSLGRALDPDLPRLLWTGEPRVRAARRPRPGGVAPGSAAAARVVRRRRWPRPGCAGRLPGGGRQQVIASTVNSHCQHCSHCQHRQRRRSP